MNYITFQKALSGFPVFSYGDIRKIEPDFDRRRLVEWQSRDYIQKIRNGFYCFHGYDLTEGYHIYISNRIYRPSYLSLESALSFYNLIPEGVFLHSAISTRKTNMFETPVGNFQYRCVRKELFFGYRIIQQGRFTIKVAEPEKAILDLMHLHRINSAEELENFRFNIWEARDRLDQKRLIAYLKLFNVDKMKERVKLFKEVVW